MYLLRLTKSRFTAVIKELFFLIYYSSVLKKKATNKAVLQQSIDFEWKMTEFDIHVLFLQHFRALAQDNQMDNALKGGGVGAEGGPEDKEERLIL